MIELTHVSKTYAGKEAKAVDDLTWTVEDGKITGFFGPNGAGKSTTLKMICGVNSVDEGTIKINGHDITTDSLAAKRQFG
jgi:ABC-2 type transport system ATP-binding protein